MGAPEQFVDHPDPYTVDLDWEGAHKSKNYAIEVSIPHGGQWEPWRLSLTGGGPWREGLREAEWSARSRSEANWNNRKCLYRVVGRSGTILSFWKSGLNVQVSARPPVVGGESNVRVPLDYVLRKDLNIGVTHIGSLSTYDGGETIVVRVNSHQALYLKTDELLAAIERLTQ